MKMRRTYQHATVLCIALYLVVSLLATNSYAYQSTKTISTKAATGLKGQVLDESGAGLTGASVSVIDPSGKEQTLTTSETGAFEFGKLVPGDYVVKVYAPGFELYTSETVNVGTSPLAPLTIKLLIAKTVDSVTVDTGNSVSLSSTENAGALIFKGKDLESLPDDPDELAQALQELAGPAAGPNGAQLFVDGFNGRVPPKNSIREIRINSNPFSAEYSQIGFGRIEILTKPGTDQLHGELSAAFNDESLNARNAFALRRAPLQVRRFGGNVSMPIIPKKASISLDFERRDIDENKVVSATILDSNFLPVSVGSTILTPQRYTNINAKLDYQVSAKNTLVSRFIYVKSDNENQGVGNFDLPSRAFNASNESKELNFILTTIFSPKVINEARLQLVRQTSSSQDLNSSPSIRVADAFVGGGAQNGQNSQVVERIEFSNNVSLNYDNHNVKTGFRLRGGRTADINTANFGGTYTFAGDVERDPTTGAPIGGTITSLEQYRRVLMGLPGYRPSQFSLRAGNPFTSVNQYDVALFVQDEWKVRNDLTLSLGARYENQTNIDSKYNFAPRIGVAYSPKLSSGQPKTVIRAGLGIFYDRFDEGLTLNARKQDGVKLIQYFTSSPDFFPNIPSTSQLNANNPTRVRVANDIDAPYTIQGSIGVEQQLPKQFTLSITYNWSRGVHMLRSRNINAPLPGTFNASPGSIGGGIRPFGDIGDIYLYESSGLSDSKQLTFGLNRRLSKRATIFASYRLGRSHSDADGVGNFPANSYDLRGEYGRSSFNFDYFVFFGGSAQLPKGFNLSLFTFFRSGQPFNITIGRDLNGDTLFTERPAFAKPGDTNVVATKFGNFNINPQPGDQIISRNLGTGPNVKSVNLNVSKTFSFGHSKQDGTIQTGNLPPGGGFGGMGRGPGGPGGGGPGGGHGGGGGFGGGGSSDSRYSLVASIRLSNLINHTNLNNFTGSLTSPIFGQSNSARDPRRIEFQLRFRF